MNESQAFVRLPELMTRAMIAAETGLSKNQAVTLMRRCPIVKIDGCRSLYVRRSDVEALLNREGRRATRPA